MNWLAPQSRFVLKTFFKRNYDYLNSGAQKLINWINEFFLSLGY